MNLYNLKYLNTNYPRMTIRGLLVLLFLRGRGKIHFDVVADGVGFPKSALTRVTEYLQIEGLITRERDENDRRKVILALMADGRSLVKVML